MTSVYKEGTSMYKIVEDGWSRGFKPEQTHQELTDHGYVCDLDTVVQLFAMFENRMKDRVEREPLIPGDWDVHSAGSMLR